MVEKETIEYPQYRKYHNGKSYFKIISPEEMEEIQLTVNSFSKHLITAKILPDRNFIYDLTFDYEKYCVKIEEGEYLEVEKNAI